MARRVPLGVLQKLMGHADVATTMRYVDVSEDDSYLERQSTTIQVKKRSEPAGRLVKFAW